VSKTNKTGEALSQFCQTEQRSDLQVLTVLINTTYKYFYKNCKVKNKLKCSADVHACKHICVTVCESKKDPTFIKPIDLNQTIHATDKQLSLQIQRHTEH